MNKLCLTFDGIVLGHTEARADDPPGQIQLSITDENGAKLFEALNVKWNLAALLEWLYENEEPLLTEQLLFYGFDTYNSVAESVRHFYDDTDVVPENDELFDLMYAYRKRHGLRFALRGSNIDDIYIGLFRGRYEISRWDHGAQWNYEIDLETFLQTVQRVVSARNH